MKPLVFAVPLLLLLLSGCNTKMNNIDLVDRKVPTSKNLKMIWRQGEVRYFDFEGGFYGLIAENGEKLLPINLSKKLQQHGAIIKFHGKILKNVVTTQQWGQVFEIKEAQLIKAKQYID